MPRELPAHLSDWQRRALSEFYAGHLSAGQLSARLSGTGEEPPAPVPGELAPAPPPDAGAEKAGKTGRPKRTAALRLVAVMAIGLAGGVIGAAVGSRMIAPQPSPAGAEASPLANRRSMPPARHHRRARPRARTAGTPGPPAPATQTEAPAPASAPAVPTTPASTTASTRTAATAPNPPPRTSTTHHAAPPPRPTTTTGASTTGSTTGTTAPAQTGASSTPAGGPGTGTPH